MILLLSGVIFSDKFCKERFTEGDVLCTQGSRIVALCGFVEIEEGYELTAYMKRNQTIGPSHDPVTWFNSRLKYVNSMVIDHKLGFSEISPSQSLLPSNLQILNLMLINLFIIVFIMLVFHCVWQK